MSWQATAWAITQQDIKDPLARFVLVCLANYASADGTSSFPSLNRLAKDTGLSESSVRRRLQLLEKSILIRKGNQAVVAAKIKRPDHRPIAYDLIMQRGVPLLPRDGTGCQADANGVSGTTERGVCGTPDPKSKRSSLEPKEVLRRLEADQKRRFGASISIPAAKAKP